MNFEGDYDGLDGINFNRLNEEVSLNSLSG